MKPLIVHTIVYIEGLTSCLWVACMIIQTNRDLFVLENNDWEEIGWGKKSQALGLEVTVVTSCPNLILLLVH